MSESVETLSPTVWCRADLELGEGPRWVDDRLFLVDILTGRLLESHAERPGELSVRAQLDVPLGAAAPVADSSDAWIVAAGTGIAFLASDGTLDWLSRPAESGSVSRRMNDAACDPFGRFWAGCMAWDATPGAGAVFRTDHDGTVTQVLDGLTIPNGPAFSADCSLMYLADSARGIIHTFPVDPSTGDLGDPAPFVELTEGSPDGMTVDDAGNLWVAIWGRGQVRQYAPDGVLLSLIPLPTQQPTAPCLGGLDGRTLFITTAAYGLDDLQRGLSGSVFALDVPIAGPPAYAFGRIAHNQAR